MDSTIVSAEWLQANINKKNLIIIDASPAQTVTGKSSDLKDLSIPGSRIFNIKEHFTDKDSPFPNTVPSPTQFEKACQILGINTDSEIVVYDNLGIYTSPRVWWLFKVMGHHQINVLDGGLAAWTHLGYKTINTAELNQDYQLGTFKSNFSSEYVISYQNIIDNIKSKQFIVVDARSKGRFDGTVDEPRKHLQSGSIPQSINIPYLEVLHNGKYKSKEELQLIFNEYITTDQQLVFSCGSGLTACIILLAREVAYRPSRYLYDGSWSEYAELCELTK